MTNLKTEQPGKAAATLKRMGAQPGDCGEGGSFTLLKHVTENLSVEQQLERILIILLLSAKSFPPCNSISSQH